MDYKEWCISTERLVLKVLDESHAEKTLEFYLRNTEFHRKWSPIREAEFNTLGFHENSLKNELDKVSKGELLKVWIFKNGDSKLEKIIGFISLNNIVRGCFHSCFVGYNMDKDEINKGYMTEALSALIEYAFKELKLHRLEANIRPANAPSLRTVEKLGFYNEGLAKKYLKIDGRWEDHIHMVLLNQELE